MTSGSPASRDPRLGIRRQAARRPGAGISTIIGTLLLTVITVVMALGLAQFLSAAQPDHERGMHVELGAGLEAGAAKWGSGDEAVVLIHRGGQDLHRAFTKILVTVGGTEHVYEGGALGSGFSDGLLQIGERWEKDLTLPPSTSVTIEVVETQDRANVVASAKLRTGATDCSTETQPPEVSAWSQDPIDLTGSHTGPVTVTVTLFDGCAGVDTTADPHLHWRLEDGSDPGFTDQGAMTHLSGTSWQLSLPEPSDGWNSHAGERLEYKVDPMTDLNGNAAASGVQGEPIEAGSPGGTLTYVTDHTVFSAELWNFTHAQDGDDGGLAATVNETPSGSGQTASEIYGTAHSSSGATAPGNATGSPDDAHAVLPGDRDWVGVKGFNTFQGAISVVELGLEGHATSGTVNGAEDELVLSYEVAGASGSTSQAFPLSELGTGSDGPVTYLDVTADRAWSWADVGNLLVQAEYTKQGQEDAVDLHVDALWVRVTYEDPAYNASLRLDIESVPAGSQHRLELGYNTTAETFHVHVWNHTLGAWAQRGDPLSEATPSTWSYVLEDDELAGGQVRVRLVDDSPDPGPKDTLHVDYLRVRTT